MSISLTAPAPSSTPVTSGFSGRGADVPSAERSDFDAVLADHTVPLESPQTGVSEGESQAEEPALADATSPSVQNTPAALGLVVPPMIVIPAPALTVVLAEATGASSSAAPVAMTGVAPGQILPEGAGSGTAASEEPVGLGISVGSTNPRSHVVESNAAPEAAAGVDPNSGVAGLTLTPAMGATGASALAAAVSPAGSVDATATTLRGTEVGTSAATMAGTSAAPVLMVAPALASGTQIVDGDAAAAAGVTPGQVGPDGARAASALRGQSVALATDSTSELPASKLFESLRPTAPGAGTPPVVTGPVLLAGSGAPALVAGMPPGPSLEVAIETTSVQTDLGAVVASVAEATTAASLGVASVLSTPVPVTTGPPALAPSPGPAPGPPVVVHQQVFTAISPFMRGADGSYSLQLQLHPYDLGSVQVHLDVRGGEISIHLLAADGAARDALRGGLSDLRQQLEDQGLRAGSMEVGSGGADTRQRETSWSRSQGMHVSGRNLVPSEQLVATAGTASSTALDLRM